jgi:hypothetical protein
MLDALNRAERYRELAEECRRLAANSLSAQMRTRYSRMAEDYSKLAEGRTGLLLRMEEPNCNRLARVCS